MEVGAGETIARGLGILGSQVQFPVDAAPKCQITLLGLASGIVRLLLLMLGAGTALEILPRCRSRRIDVHTSMAKTNFKNQMN